jgi:hypothetical protein
MLTLVLIAATAFMLPIGSKPALQEYEFTENYIYEDSNSHPAPWQPHSRTGDGRFRLPVRNLHWVIVVTYPPNVKPGGVPLECHLSDEQGEVAKFSGLEGSLPDPTYPLGGKTQWIATFDGKTSPWKLGKYKIEISTPTKSLNTSFEILPASKAAE